MSSETESLSDQELEKLGFEWGTALAKRTRLDQESKYVFDLICALWPAPAGMSRSIVLHTVRRAWEKERRALPRKFDEAVQSAFNKHCADSKEFKKRDVPAAKALFYWPEGPGTGRWAMHRDRALDWLNSLNKIS